MVSLQPEGQINSVALHNNLAVCFFENEQFDKAVEEYRVALSFAPDNKEIIYGLARCYEKTSLTAQARALYKLLLPSSKDMPYIHIRMAGLSLQEDNLKKAKEEVLLTENENNTVAALTLKKAKEKLLDLMEKSKKSEEKKEENSSP